MDFKADGDMSLEEYWREHCTFIAKDRSWAIQKGDQYSSKTCTTLRQYDDYIRKVAGYLDMPIAEITPVNIMQAVSDVAKTYKYQEATVKTIISALRDVFFLCRHIRPCLQHPRKKSRGRQIDESYDLDDTEDLNSGSGKRGAERIER